MEKATIKNLLDTACGAENVFEDVPMAEHTSFKAGGRAELMIVPQSADGLKTALEILSDSGYPHIVLGNGSNILVRDGGYRGAIVKIGKPFDYVKADGEVLICGAAALLSSVARSAAAESLEGFEFASGIPGSVGGAVFMNAGAYGGEMAHVIRRVRAVSGDGKRDFHIGSEKLQMGYRHTLLHETGDIVIEAEINLKRGNREEIKAKIADLTARRNSKQPVAYPSAGSFFKRPEGYFAGALIQDAGLKGLSVGGAQVSELHAGFIVNKGGATATDILQLMEIVQAKVMEDSGVMLEPEVRIIGEKL